jgi:hypothetical protein
MRGEFNFPINPLFTRMMAYLLQIIGWEESPLYTTSFILKKGIYEDHSER